MTDYVAADAFPCVGARSASNKGRVRFGEYEALGDERDIAVLCDDLHHFSREFPDPGSEPVTFCAMFRTAVPSEGEFARLMWRHLQSMHAHDSATFGWDPAVGCDPAEADFSFSIAGRAFFVVGLSPVASRLARRSPTPSLVFNFHDQFEHLRANGKYAGLQKVIRRRDIALQGAINPVLARFGEASEARQYSGVAVESGWQCPFRRVEGVDAA